MYRPVSIRKGSIPHLNCAKIDRSLLFKFIKTYFSAVYEVLKVIYVRNFGTVNIFSDQPSAYDEYKSGLLEIMSQHSKLSKFLISPSSFIICFTSDDQLFRQIL